MSSQPSRTHSAAGELPFDKSRVDFYKQALPDYLKKHLVIDATVEEQYGVPSEDVDDPRPVLIHLRASIVLMRGADQAECSLRGRYFMERHHFKVSVPISELADAIFTKGIASVFPEAAENNIYVSGNRFAKEIAAIITKAG